MRIGEQLTVVLGIVGMIVVELGPALPVILGAEHSAQVVLGRHGGVDGPRVMGRHFQGDAADVRLRQAVGDLLPGGTGIGGLVDGPFRAAGDEDPHVTTPLVGGSVDDVGVPGVEDDVGDAGILRHVQDSLPGLPTVGGLVEASFPTAGPEGSLGCGIDHVGVARVDKDVPDVLGSLQPHAPKALPPIRALVDPVPVAGAPLGGVLAGADPYHVGMEGIHRHGADGIGAVVVEDGLPADAPVGGLPDIPRRDADVPDAPVRWGRRPRR